MKKELNRERKKLREPEKALSLGKNNKEEENHGHPEPN